MVGLLYHKPKAGMFLCECPCHEIYMDGDTQQCRKSPNHIEPVFHIHPKRIQQHRAEGEGDQYEHHNGQARPP